MPLPSCLARAAGAGLVAIGVLVATGCAGSSTTTPSSSTAPPAASASEIPPPDEPTAPTAPTAPEATGPTTSPPSSPATGPDHVLPDGFDRIAARVTTADGTVCDLCLWLADDADRRARGLMFVTDLGPADGMAFRYPSPHTGRFWMKNTLLPLSIAFFGPDGTYLDAFDMEPCTADPCPRYPTPEGFLVAVEVPNGELPGAGMAPGSTLELLDLPCDGA